MNEWGTVTPFTGVWIEIGCPLSPGAMTTVTPFTGVWIEISLASPDEMRRMSHPSRVCGLKYDMLKADIPKIRGHTLHGCVD